MILASMYHHEVAIVAYSQTAPHMDRRQGIWQNALLPNVKQHNLYINSSMHDQKFIRRSL